MAQSPASGAGRGADGVGIVRGILVLLLLLELLFHAALLLGHLGDPLEICLSAAEAADYVDLSHLWLQTPEALLAAVLSFCSFSSVLRAHSGGPRAGPHFLSALLAQLSLLLLLSACARPAHSAPADGVGAGAGAVSPRARLSGSLLLRLAAAGSTLAALGAALASPLMRCAPLSLEQIEVRPAFRHLFVDEAGVASLARLERALELRSVRASIRRQLRAGTRRLLALAAAALGLALSSFATELRRTLGAAPPLLGAEAVAAVSAAPPEWASVPLQPRGSARVVLLIVSALRVDALDQLPAFRALLATPELQRDSRRLTLRAGPPAASVPQWLALLCGASPTISGVWGDRPQPETNFDSVLRQARLHGLSPFLTGSPWLTALFASQLHTTNSAGALLADAALAPSPQTTLPRERAAAIAPQSDSKRLALLLRALRARRAYETPLAETPRRGPSGAGRFTDGGARPLFELLVAQLSDAQAQARCAGAAAAWNAGASYARALSNVSAAVRSLVAELDARTTLLVVADHGTVDGGASGGAEPQATSVPLLVYRPGSNLGVRWGGERRAPTAASGGGAGAAQQLLRRAEAVEASPWRATEQAEPTLRSVDLAPTLCALLGLPVPRASEGNFIEQLMPLANQALLPLHYRDLFSQQQRLAAALAAELAAPEPPSLSEAERDLLSKDVRMEGGTSTEAGADIQRLRDGIFELQALRRQLLSRAFAAGTRLAFVVSFFGSCVAMLLWAWLLQRASFAEPWLALFPRRGQRANRHAALASLAALAAYFVLCSAGYALVLRARGYAALDSTVVHDPLALIVYLQDKLALASVSALVVIRSFHFPLLVASPFAPPPGSAEREKFKMEEERRLLQEEPAADPRREHRYGSDAASRKRAWPLRLPRVCAEYARCLLLGHEPVYSDVALLYLYELYLLSWALLATLLLLCLQSLSYSSPLPQLLPVRFDLELGWSGRFELLTLQLDALILLGAAALALCLLPSAHLSAAYYDRLYTLGLLKLEHRHGPSERCDDLILLLEEETEALVRAHFQQPAHEAEFTEDD